MPEKPGAKFLEIRRKRREASRRESDRSYGRKRRDGDVTALYGSARWKDLRKLKLGRNPLCESCLADGRVVPAQTVHHVKEAKDRPDLFFCLSNLRSLCFSCHNRIHGKERTR